MAGEKPSNEMKIPETGPWSPEAQNKIRDVARADIQHFVKADLAKYSDPTQVKYDIQEGQTLGAIAFAFDKAYKNLGKDLKINWGTSVEFTRDGKTQTVKLAEVNPKDFTIYEGDVVQLKEVGGKWVITVNAPAQKPESPEQEEAPEQETMTIDVPVIPVHKVPVELSKKQEVQAEKVRKVETVEKK